MCARVLGEAVLLGAAVVLSVGQGWGWLLVASIGALIFLDAAFDFCLLCALTYHVGRLLRWKGQSWGSSHA